MYKRSIYIYARRKITIKIFYFKALYNKKKKKLRMNDNPI